MKKISIALILFLGGAGLLTAADSGSDTGTYTETDREITRYLGLGLRTATWSNYANISSNTGFGNMVDHDTNIHSIVDFTMALGNNFLLGLIIDLDDSADRLRRFGVRAGYGDWQIYLERGRVTGSLNPDYRELTLQPAYDSFDHPYTYAAIYRQGTIMTGGRTGIGYLEWTMPTSYFVSTLPGRSVEYVDPSTTFQILGHYAQIDPLKDLVDGIGTTGFNFGLMAIHGFSRISPSDEDLEYLSMLHYGEEFNNDPTFGITQHMTLRLGYYGRLGQRGSRTFVYGIGYEVNQMVTFTGGIFTDMDDPYRIRVSGILGAINTGPFIHVMGGW